jgi:tetratricopeptide (TPR) repeat protein
MNQAQAGIAADSTNAVHYYIGGEAAAGLGNYALADSLWTIAERIYPAYERDIEPTREVFWVEAFNAGIQAFNMGNTAEAIEAWRKADMIYRLRPDAAQNLGILLSQGQQYAEAIDVYTRALENLSLVPATWVIDEMERVSRAQAKAAIQDNLVQILLFTDAYAQAEPILREAIRERPTDIELQANLAVTLAGLNRSDEATEIYNRILATPNVPPAQLFNIGVALFGADEPRRAAEAFARVTQIQPNSRDAWFNQANALYEAASNITDPAQALPVWTELATVASRHIAIDPLSETASLIQAAALRESMRNNEALAALERSEALPVHLEEMTIVLCTTKPIVGAALTFAC